MEWSRCWCCLVLLAPSSLLPPARAISHHFYSNLALQQQLFLLGSRSAAGGNNKMKITANLLYREVWCVSRVCTGRCTVTHIIVDCGNFKSVFYSMCFRWSPVEHSRTMDYGVTQVTSVVMTVSQSVRRVRLSSPFTPAVLPVASQPASPTPLPSLVSISDL